MEFALLTSAALQPLAIALTVVAVGATATGLLATAKGHANRLRVLARAAPGHPHMRNVASHIYREVLDIPPPYPPESKGRGGRNIREGEICRVPQTNIF